MSHFYASIEGNRGMATRCGTKNSGIQGHIRGWRVGAKVECDVNCNGKDVVRVYSTGGSRSPMTQKLIAEFTEK